MTIPAAPSLPAPDAPCNDPAGGATPVDHFEWIGGSAGSWTDPANWLDLSTGAVATRAPGADDSVLIDGGTGTSITGAGQAYDITLTGSVLFDGSFETGTLVEADTSGGVSLTAEASLLVIGRGAALDDALANAAVGPAGMISVAQGATLLMPAVAINAPIWNNGTIVLAADSAIPASDIEGAGTVLIESGFEASVIEAAMTGDGPVVGADQILRFDGPNASLYLANGANDPSTPILVQNFGQADDIAVFGSVESFQVTGTAAGDLLELVELVGGVHGTISTQYILFDQDYAGQGLGFSVDPVATGAFDRGYTDITVTETAACFCLGTLISTPDGDRAVETLRIGDAVHTADGGCEPVLWIGRRSYGARFAAGRDSLRPIRIRAGALGGGLPRRDLLVSPQHAMLVRGVLVPAELLVNNRTVVREPVCGDVHYLHVELDSAGLLLAEGSATESFVDDQSRALFQNAAEFATLYPDRPTCSPVWSRPRVTDGEALLAAQRHVEALAGLVPTHHQQTLRGRVDNRNGDSLRGWAWCPDRPDAPVLLEIVADGAVIAQVLADRYRADLEAAGIGNGCHAFEAVLPDRTGRVEVRRARDGVRLAA